MARTKAQTPDEALAMIEAAALSGRRCPQLSEGLNATRVAALARDGKIAVEVSTHNFRRITILTGPHEGKSTAANPLKKHSVYMTIDASGTRINGRLRDTGGAKRTQPSAPQLLPISRRVVW